jgi:glutaredoxin
MQARCVMRWSLILALLIAGAAHAQLYRWTDEKGRVHITDTPPPPSAKDVQKKKPAAGGSDTGQQPFELAQAIKEFPVVLYTAPMCKEPCAKAREALNKRGVPFKEVQVYEADTAEELTRVSGGRELPTLLVGRSVQKGFEQGAYDALLDAARYPKAGLLPPRVQAAPKEPEGYVSPEEREAAKAAPPKPVAEEAPPRGPYSPGSTPPPRRTPPQQ